MIHTIILLVLAYAVLKAIFKRKPKDFMEGRLVGRPTHAASEIRGTIITHSEIDDIRHRSRDLIDAYETAWYRADCAKRREKFERDLI